MSIKQNISKRILSLLEQNILPWRSNRGVPVNPKTGSKYAGINLLSLSAAAQLKNYRNNWWATYQQWHALGFQVAKRPEEVSEWGVNVLNWKDNKMQHHVVFNAEQVFGPDLKKYLISENIATIADYSQLQDIVDATKVIIEHSAECKLPQYQRDTDKIILPLRNDFLNEQQYFATVVHELFHWAESRLGWTGSAELGELIAEIGTGYLESHLNLPHDEDMKNCNEWLPIWIKSIDENPQFLFEAAAQATKTLDFILNLQSQNVVV